MMQENVFEVGFGRVDARTGPAQGPWGCRHWLGAKWGGGPYGKIRNPFRGHFQDQPVFLRVHRLVFMLHTGTTMLPTHNNDGQLMDVSHICHHPACCNFDHLSYEPHVINMDRLTCQGLNTCTHNHQPHCLL